MDTTSLPTGTVTLLFTDIEGSIDPRCAAVPLWEQHPEAIPSAQPRRGCPGLRRSTP